MFFLTLRSLPVILLDKATAFEQQASCRYSMQLAPRSAGPYIGSYVIYWFSLPFNPQIRFINCLNKSVSAHPSLYCAQIRPISAFGSQ